MTSWILYWRRGRKVRSGTSSSTSVAADGFDNLFFGFLVLVLVVFVVLAGCFGMRGFRARGGVDGIGRLGDRRHGLRPEAPHALPRRELRGGGLEGLDRLWLGNGFGRRLGADCCDGRSGLVGMIMAVMIALALKTGGVMIVA